MVQIQASMRCVSVQVVINLQYYMPVHAPDIRLADASAHTLLCVACVNWWLLATGMLLPHTRANKLCNDKLLHHAEAALACPVVAHTTTTQAHSVHLLPLPQGSQRRLSRGSTVLGLPSPGSPTTVIQPHITTEFQAMPVGPKSRHHGSCHNTIIQPRSVAALHALPVPCSWALPTHAQPPQVSSSVNQQRTATALMICPR